MWAVSLYDINLPTAPPSGVNEYETQVNIKSSQQPRKKVMLLVFFKSAQTLIRKSVFSD